MSGVFDHRWTCDQCHAASGYYVVKVGESELIFCGHHYQKNLSHIIEQGYHVDDYSDRINEKPSVSANSDG